MAVLETMISVETAVHVTLPTAVFFFKLPEAFDAHSSVTPVSKTD